MSDYTCFDIANYFLNLANETGTYLSNLKLQKLVYYAQAWYLANHDKSLFDEDFEAWVHGPVIYDLWKKYKEFSYNPIFGDVEKPKIDKKTWNFLGLVTDSYFSEDAYTLELMTHKEDPWILARNGIAPDEPCSSIITKESMKTYFRSRLDN
ncbi:hypothetical protein LCGC14_1883470 [marine sediment metagenome]|uniref:Antitoxin SocA-like Panacea domain-containing protein n=1 Tax=marine sediment metagenome TaxID=412755 RepID=A0A0F9G1M7_9ZZZZ